MKMTTSLVATTTSTTLVSESEGWEWTLDKQVAVQVFGRNQESRCSAETTLVTLDRTSAATRDGRLGVKACPWQSLFSFVTTAQVAKMPRRLHCSMRGHRMSTRKSEVVAILIGT